ncbi:unnamed protein product [Nesidiocoris tenuis]|uniref:Uncharacterized protein n=1 Tax=Nesidiocoris tenuis TaxID=355587 RepID=A0A6H5FTZ0_9HEMI|nr:unnamed protein product [Nesidiocoris tenuis]
MGAKLFRSASRIAQDQICELLAEPHHRTLMSPAEVQRTSAGRTESFCWILVNGPLVKGARPRGRLAFERFGRRPRPRLTAPGAD